MNSSTEEQLCALLMFWLVDRGAFDEIRQTARKIFDMVMIQMDSKR